MTAILSIVIIVFCIRLVFLKLSIKNEKNILANGGKEYGVENSKRITILHILFYLLSVIEVLFTKPSFDTISIFGLGLLIFSMGMLYWVTRLLDPIWTVKLMIANNHQFVDHWLFRTVKHPNYFLNIMPELVGLSLLCHSKLTFALLSIPYAYVLYKRIEEENQLIKDVIIPNKK